MLNSLFLSSLSSAGRSIPLLELPFPFLPATADLSGKAGTRVFAAKVSFKALPLATDKTAEDPPDLLSKKLARNFLPRSAQLLSELIKKDRKNRKLLSKYRKNNFFSFFPATVALKIPLQMYTCMCVCFYKCVYILNLI